MPKHCIPGIVCFENTSIFLVFMALFIVAAVFFVQGYTKNAGANAGGAGGAGGAGAGGVGAGGAGAGGANAGGSFLARHLPSLVPTPTYPSVEVRADPRLAVSDVRGDVLLNPYAPPVKNDGYFLPINVRTQGVESAYRQVGILTPAAGGEKAILPLMGRPLIVGRDTWQYYTMSEKNNIKLPISRGKKSCMNEYGCDKLYDGDTVYVQGYNGVFNVTVYDNDVIRYLPVF